MVGAQHRVLKLLTELLRAGEADIPAANTLLAKIQPEHWHLSDHYAIHYEQKQDELPLLLLALAIDCIKDAAQH